MFNRCAALVAAVMVLCAPVSGAMKIVLTPDAGLAANPAALAAFNRAAKAWTDVFTNNITINISAGLSSSFASSNIIGSTNSVKLPASYSFFRDRLMASAANEPDDGIVAHLPTLAQFTATLPGGITVRKPNPDNGINFVATKANFKALGYMDLINLDTAYGANDATITFNSNFSFDYDSSNGVTAGKIDFQTVATHEIGHALGFISSVDTVDFYKNTSTPALVSISPLDLFRFQDNAPGKDPATFADFTAFPRYLDTGGNAIFDDLNSERALSTGRYTGDGLEASHWKDDAITGKLLGIMDPSINGNMVETISANDIRALDLIGYNYVPEPAGLSILIGLASLLRRPGPRSRR